MSSMRNRAVQYVNGADSDEPDLLHDGPPKATCLVHGALPPDDDLYFYRWAGDVRSRRRLKITAFFHALGAAAHGSAMIATLYWARMEIYVNVTRQEIYRVDSDALSDVPSNATPSWSRRDVLYVRWHPSWVIFTFFALSFTFHLVEGASLLGFLCCVAVEKNQIVADLLTWWNRWYVVSLYRCCTPTRWLEYVFSASLQVMNLAALTAITDFSSILTVGALMATTQLFGLLQEMYSMALILPAATNESGIVTRRQWMPHTWRLRLSFWALGFVPYVACWYVLIDQILRNIAAADMGNGVFLRVLLGSQLVSFTSFALVQLVNILHTYGPEWYAVGELMYTILSFTAKALFGVIAIQESLGPDGKYDDLSFFVIPNRND